MDGRDGAVGKEDAVSTGPHGAYTDAFAKAHHTVRYIIRPVGAREHPCSTLGLQRDAVLFKKSHHVSRRKPIEGTVEKPTVTGYILHKIPHRAVVGEVTPSLSGDTKLPAQLSVAVQHNDAVPACGSLISAHHPGGSAADDNKVTVCQCFHAIPPR
jgi:hypothetical protein